MNNYQNNNYNGSYNNNYNNYNNGNNQGYQGQEYNNYSYQENYQTNYDNQNYQMNNNYDNQNNYSNYNNYNNNPNQSQGYNQGQIQNEEPNCLEDISKLKIIDPSFNPDEFKVYAKDLYLKLQDAWTNDFKYNTWNNDIRQYMTDDLFNFYSKQLNRLKRKNHMNIISNEHIMCHIEGYKELTNYDMIVVSYRGTLIDYVIDLNSNSLIIGNSKDSVSIHETFIFIRTKTMRNPEMMKTYNCVYCGAGLEANSNRCPYCEGINVVDNSPNWIFCKAVKGQVYKYQGGR